MRRAIVLLAVVVAMLAAVLPASAGDPIDIRIKRLAQLTDQGAIVVDAAVRCDPVGDVLEAFIDVTQDDQRIWGHGPFRGLVCDGRWHDYLVHVAPIEEPFHLGAARASAYVLLCSDAAQDCYSDGAVRFLRVR